MILFFFFFRKIYRKIYTNGIKRNTISFVFLDEVYIYIKVEDELFRNRNRSVSDSRKKRSNRRKLIYLVQSFLRGGKRSTTRERIWVSSRRRFTRKLLSLGGHCVEIRKVASLSLPPLSPPSLPPSLPSFTLVSAPRKVKFRTVS